MKVKGRFRAGSTAKGEENDMAAEDMACASGTQPRAGAGLRFSLGRV